jgi:hypothetical protein
VRPHDSGSGRVTRGVDGRLVVAGVLATYLAAVAVARIVFGFDLWWWLGVWTNDWIFLDTQNITSAAECWRQGHDVLRDNPCDPLGRALNYPRVWLVLALFGMDRSWTIALGLVICGLFFAAVWFLLDRLSVKEAVIVAAAVCAPAVMLGVERGQNDLLLFDLLVTAVILWRSHRLWSGAASPLLVFVAAVLKLFPAVALGAFVIARGRRAALVATGAGAAFLVYAAVTFGDLQAIRHALPQSDHYAYGARILVDVLGWAIAPEQWAALGMSAHQLIAAAPLAGVSVVGWMAWSRSQLLKALTPVREGPDGWRRLAFHMGALVYVGTFATTNNWDYRLVFLLLCLPQLLEWLRSTQHRLVGRLGTAAVLLQLWAGPYARDYTLLDGLWSWSLACALLVLLVPGARRAWAELRGDTRASVGL